MHNILFFIILHFCIESTVIAGGIPAKELYSYGVDEYLMKNYEAAIFEFEEAICVDPKHLESYKMLARCLYRLGHLEEALRKIKQAQNLAPSDPEIHEIIILIHSKFVAKNEMK